MEAKSRQFGIPAKRAKIHFLTFCVFKKNASHLGEHHHFRVLSVKPKQRTDTKLKRGKKYFF
jgi:hypothetical protein